MSKWRKRMSANVLFAIVGIALIIGSIYWLISMENFKKTAGKIEATITSITQYEDSEGETQTNAFASYIVDGVSYSNYIGYKAGMKEGDTVTLYYQPSDPQKIQDTTNSFVAIAMIVLGALCCFVGFFPVIYKLLPDNRERVE